MIMDAPQRDAVAEALRMIANKMKPTATRGDGKLKAIDMVVALEGYATMLEEYQFQNGETVEWLLKTVY